MRWEAGNEKLGSSVKQQTENANKKKKHNTQHTPEKMAAATGVQVRQTGHDPDNFWNSTGKRVFDYVMNSSGMMFDNIGWPGGRQF